LKGKEAEVPIANQSLSTEVAGELGAMQTMIAPPIESMESDGHADIVARAIALAK
jgi:hypothetical protein